MDNFAEHTVRALLFVAGLLTLPALSPAVATALVDYQLVVGALALVLLGAAGLLLRAVRREARWNNPRPSRQEP
jgi:hypothetical protein